MKNNKHGAIKHLLLANSYWALSKPLVYALGLETAFLLCNFAEAENLSKNGWFYQTIKTVEEKTTLSRRKQDRCIEQLTELGILETKVMGVPAKRHFRINYSKVEEIMFANCTNKFVRNEQTRVSEPNKQECAKRTTNKELNNKEPSNKEPNIKEYGPAKAEPSIPYKKIIEYLNSKTGRQFNFKGQANRRLIKARFNEGYTEDDFYKVIDIKTEEWTNTDMEKYLRPNTLFGNKFDGYLNQEPVEPVKEDKKSKEDSPYSFTRNGIDPTDNPLEYYESLIE